VKDVFVSSDAADELVIVMADKLTDKYGCTKLQLAQEVCEWLELVRPSLGEYTHDERLDKLIREGGDS